MKTVVLLFVSMAVAFGQVVPGRYIIQLSGESAATHAVRLGHRANSSDSEFRARLATLRQDHLRMRKTLEAAGAEVLGETSVIANLFFVRFPSERAAELAAIPGVVRIHPVRLFRHTLDHALPLLKVPDAWNQIGGQANAGAGIKVAVIDTGIDSSHPAFNDPSLTPPSGFPKTNQPSDAAYTNGKIIVARSYSINSAAVDSDGHGTGVAMIVAGATVTGPNGPITGIAPKAFLGNYKVFADGPDPLAADSDIIAAIDDAVSDGMDILTLSLGSIPASRPADDALVQVIEAAAAVGKIVTISAGNSGSDPNTIGSPGIAPDAITVGSRPNDRIFAASVQTPGIADIPAVPGNGPNSPDPVSGPLADVTQFDPSGLACGSLPAGSLAGSVALILRGVCPFENKIDNAQQAGAVAVLVYNDAARSTLFGMNVGAAGLPASSIGYADGALLKQLAAAGSLTVTLVFTLGPVAVNPNSLTSFSSRGPNTDNGIKPDLIAIGENVYTADLTGNGGYVVESGTSFSAPMAAGAAALIEAARPGLTSRQYRSLLVNSAVPLALDSGALLKVQQQGAGFLNVLAAINSTVTADPVSLSFGIGSGTIDRIGTLALTNVGTATDTFSITVQPMGNGPAPSLSNNTVQLDPGQTQNISVELAGSSLDPGAYQGYLQIQGANNPVIASVPYWYGVPSGTAAYETVLNVPANPTPNTRQTIFVRATDSQGLPVGTPPSVTVTSGGGRVLLVESADSDFPGVFAIAVRLGASVGTNVFHIATGDAAVDVTM
jgi:minor extracellular serine protease Vpr